MPDMTSPGTYAVQYQVYDDQDTYDTLYRYVTIRASQPPLELTLNKGITSLFVGDNFTDPGVQYAYGSLTVESNVNTNIPGIYTITYTLSNQTQTIKRIRYVHVFDAPDMVASLTPLYITRKREVLR
jgi:hypothetical protein